MSFPIETKVWAAIAGAVLGGTSLAPFLVYVISVRFYTGHAVPSPVANFIGGVIGALVVGLAGYQAAHSPRPIATADPPAAGLMGTVAGTFDAGGNVAAGRAHVVTNYGPPEQVLTQEQTAKLADPEAGKSLP